MKTRFASYATKLCVFIVVTSVNFAGPQNVTRGQSGKYRSVESGRIPGILRMISATVRSNYERVKTWEGEKSVVIRRVYEGPKAAKMFRIYTDGAGEAPPLLVKHTESKIEFALDIEKDLLWVNHYRKSPSRFTDLATGRDLGTKSVPHFVRSVVTPEYIINCSPDRMDSGVVLSRNAVKQARQNLRGCQGSPVFDPRGVFGSPEPIWELISTVLEYLAKHGEWDADGYTMRVEERVGGSETEYRIVLPGKLSSEPGKQPPEYYPFVTRTFSSRCGFNITSYEVTYPNGRLLRRQTWSYERLDGVYLPSRTMDQKFSPDSGNVASDKVCTFRNLRLNHAIPEETFTYKNLSLQNGDKFVDKILGKEHTYQNGTLIPVTKKK